MSTSVALFIGCLNDVYYPRVGIAITKILEHFGCRVSFLDAQTCCGAPIFQDGFEPEAKTLARRFVEIFQTSDYIVTPSPRCCAMVREEYTYLLLDDPKWETAMWQVAGRTYEFVEFLTTVMKADLSKLSLPQHTELTYHPACQLRSMGVVDDSPRLIRQVKNVHYRLLADGDRCCGGGGGLPAKQRAISNDMRDQKIRTIAETGVAAVICNEAVCAMRLRTANVSMRHVAELIAEAMGIDVETF